MGGKKSMMLSSACMVMMILVSSVSGFINPPNKDPKDEEFLPCLGSWGSVISCEGFMSGNDEQPAGECCDTLQGLDREAMKSEDDQKKICQCFENSIAGFTIYPEKLIQLTQICGTSYLPNDINFDCNFF